jgi:transcriptional regulator with XRE-family HTH domain
VLIPSSSRMPEYIYLLSEAHERSGMSLRDVAQASDLDPTYVHYILKGARRPQRDVIIALGFAYRLERIEVDEILLLAGLPPLGRGALREYRQQLRKSSATQSHY